MTGFFLKNANVINVKTCTVEENKLLYIVDGRFAETSSPIGIDEPVIDCEGKFVSPGIIDAHVHLVWDGASPDPMADTLADGDFVCFAKGCSNANKSLKAGVTLVRDVGSCNDTAIPLAASINRGYIQGSRVIPCGGAIQGSYGHCPMIGTICDTKGELIKKIKQLKGAFIAHRIAPPHWIKIMASGGAAGLEDLGPCMYSVEELEAIACEAHRLNIKVAAQALSYDASSKCVYAGIDTIEHGAELDEELLLHMKAHDQTWVPTVAVYKVLSESRGVVADIIVDKSEGVTKKQRAIFKKAMEIGTQIMMGSDAGSANFGPHPSGLMEMCVMEDYGMPKAEVLRCSTYESARILGVDKTLGSIEAAKLADFVILAANPLEKGARAYIEDLCAVYKLGELVK